MLIEGKHRRYFLDIRNKAHIEHSICFINDEDFNVIEHNPATLKKIKDILNAYDKLNGASDKPAESSSSGGGDGAPTMESKDTAALEAKVALMESREKCRDLLESAGVKSSPVRLKSLAPLNDDERKELIAEWKASDAPSRPRTAAPLYESKDGDADGAIPTDGKKFAQLLRR